MLTNSQISAFCIISNSRINESGVLVDWVLKDRTVVIGRKFNDIDEF